MTLKMARGWRFGLTDNFVITDENGKELYTAKGNAIKQQLFDLSGNLLGVLDSGKGVIARLAEIREYTLYVDGKKVGLYRRNEKLIGYEYEFEGLPWTFDRANDEIKEGDNVLATLKDATSFFLHFLSFASRKYEADVPNEEHAVPAALVTLGWHYFESR